MVEHSSYPLAQFTTFGIGGVAERFLIPENIEELVSLAKSFRTEGRKYRILGNGSNLLIASRRVKEPVIYTKNALQNYSVAPDGKVEAGGSVDIRVLINNCANRGLRAPVELLTIPASVGGAIYMNAGRTTYGVTISDNLESVKVFDGDQIRLMPVKLCGFGHRQSIFQSRKELVILGATFRFQPVDKQTINSVRKETLKAGADKCYRTNKSAGSVFSKCDFEIMKRFQGMKIGAAMYAPRTLNCILNMGGAKAYQVLLLIKAVQVMHCLKRKPCRLEIEVW